MFNSSYLRACMKLLIVQKIRFPFLSLGGPSYGARVWWLGRVSHILSFRSLGVVSLFIFPTGPTALDSEPRGRRYAKNTGHDRNRLYSRAIHFPYSSFQQARQPSISSPVEEDTSKIWDTTGTVFIQGPSIVLPVWRSIIFNGSFLRACGFLIHPSNRSDSPQFRGPWKKICQKYDIQQEPSLFKGHPLSC